MEVLLKKVPEGSPLGEVLYKMLENTNGEGDLDPMMMLHQCARKWPKIRMGIPWPWVGTKDEWAIAQLSLKIKKTKGPRSVELIYIKEWEKLIKEEVGLESPTRMCPLKEQETNKKKHRKEWDPLSHLPPPQRSHESLDERSSKTKESPESPRAAVVPQPPGDWTKRDQEKEPEPSEEAKGPFQGTRARMKMYPLKEVPMGGGAIGFVNAPLMASEVREFKRELVNFMEDPAKASEQVDQFLGPNLYSWSELQAILNILFNSEEKALVRAAAIKVWDREKRAGPPGEVKVPHVDPNWDPNSERDRREMEDMRVLIIRGIREAVPKVVNTRRVFEEGQGKEETPTEWLERVRGSIRKYGGVDLESAEGRMLLKMQFVTKSWPDIRKKLEKLEDWHDREITELLKEAIKIYVKRDEEKAQHKARVMVALAQECAKESHLEKGNERGPPPSWATPTPGRERKTVRFTPRPTDRNRERTPLTQRKSSIKERGTCYSCGKTGHFRSECPKMKEGEDSEEEAVTRILRGELRNDD